MRSVHLAGLALAVAMGSVLPLTGSAQAAMGGALPSTQTLLVEKAQFFFLGHNFCWYDDGWQGPGWYWCNYAWRSGYGWGGGEGWRGWNHREGHSNRGPHGMSPRDHVDRSPPIYGGHAPLVPGGHAPQIKSGAPPRGAGPQGGPPHGAGPSHGGAGPGAPPCPPGKC